jgi:hypothetical protein
MNRPAVLRNIVQEFTSIAENLFVGNLYDGVECDLNFLRTMSWSLVLFGHKPLSSCHFATMKTY